MVFIDIDLILPLIEPTIPASAPCCLPRQARPKPGVYISVFWWTAAFTREKHKTIIITSKDKISITESLNSIEARLTGNTFFRSHRAYIVNLNMIREIHPWGKNGYEITFSGTRQTAILALSKAKELEKILALPGN
ncbi:LytTR family DNA-binding domain-containing protein [Desulfoscipio geothermicus]|uniref:LytTr DNA-binding domain-containing protein n=1 Tax=Desulfoscipio geothermicus DSM 3669 TaxID=1121426 RepID=A0A1I6EL83_9FIRM|nr:LytTR family DNA-binding domain-containing protein [Desulfoscipio geothermicus]SFR18278.1 LytTr DNA-binding domain-containing protein [Desulfoscipio geothermicus DSM 3669]